MDNTLDGMHIRGWSASHSVRSHGLLQVSHCLTFCQSLCLLACLPAPMSVCTLVMTALKRAMRVPREVRALRSLVASSAMCPKTEAASRILGCYLCMLYAVCLVFVACLILTSSSCCYLCIALSFVVFLDCFVAASCLCIHFIASNLHVCAL